MKKFLLVFFINFLFFNTLSAEVTQFVFVTEKQGIPVSTLSETITVQSQNSLGERENTEETFDFVFSSNSPTGEFLSTSGNSVSLTMSRGTANKNFLYRDSTAGTYTISITATGRVSLQSFTANQEIIIGGEVLNTDQEEENTETQNEEEKNANTVPINNTLSAHSSSAPLTNAENKIDFTVSAGRDRLTTVGNELVFEASPIKLQNISKQYISHEWSFGDGSRAVGEVVRHTYKHPGDYIVVLNSSSSDKKAVSRLNVKVVSPDLTIKKVHGGLEVTNKSTSEINLGDWIISNEIQEFKIAKDTLIPKNKSIVFASSLTGINSDNVNLKNPIGTIIHSLGPDATTTPENSLAMIQTKIDEVKIALGELPILVEEEEPKVVFVPSVKNNPEVVVETEKDFVEIQESSDNLALVFEAEKESGIIVSILSLPVKGFNFIKRLFVEE